MVENVAGVDDEIDLANRVARYTSRKFRPEPPEGNVVYALGVSDSSGAQDMEKALWSAPCANRASIVDPASRSYLARVKHILYPAEGVRDQGLLNRMARVLLAAAGYWRFPNTITVADYVPGLRPDTRVHLRGELADRSRAVLHSGLWIHKRSLQWEQSGIETMTLTLKSVWETEIED